MKRTHRANDGDKTMTMKSYELSFGMTDEIELTEELEREVYSSDLVNECFITSCDGRVSIGFELEAHSALEAVCAAMEDLKRLGSLYDCALSVSPVDLVTQSEIALRQLVSRQMIHQYVRGERGKSEFPSPLSYLENRKPVWSYVDVLRWLEREQVLSVTETDIEDSIVLKLVNDALATRQNARFHKELHCEVTERLSCEAKEADAFHLSMNFQPPKPPPPSQELSTVFKHDSCGDYVAA